MTKQNQTPIEDDQALLDDADIVDNPATSGIDPESVGSGSRVSDTTNIHDEGSDANDTADGLTESEEAVRHAAEDIPTGASPAGRIDNTPVFDRGGLPPKV